MKNLILIILFIVISFTSFAQRITFEESQNPEILLKHYKESTFNAFQTARSNKTLEVNCADTIEIYINHDLVFDKVSYLMKSTNLNGDFILKSDKLDGYFFVSPTYEFALIEIFNRSYNSATFNILEESIINDSNGHKFKLKYVIHYK